MESDTEKNGWRITNCIITISALFLPYSLPTLYLYYSYSGHDNISYLLRKENDKPSKANLGIENGKRNQK